jgi:glucose-fructose oxidoreductase
VYCINAARNLFGTEPTHVSAQSVHSGVASLEEIDETTACTLRFPGGRIASFVTSFNAADVASLRLVGTKGHVRLDPAYEYAEALSMSQTVDGKTRQRTGKKHDQFAAELVYFSDCIREDREPEPSGEEGLQDVRIVQALYRSARSGRPVRLPEFSDRRRPSRRQRISRPAVSKPALVKVQSASRD